MDPGILYYHKVPAPFGDAVPLAVGLTPPPPPKLILRTPRCNCLGPGETPQTSRHESTSRGCQEHRAGVEHDQRPRPEGALRMSALRPCGAHLVRGFRATKVVVLLLSWVVFCFGGDWDVGMRCFLLSS